MIAELTTLEPGIHAGIPSDRYHSLPHLSASMLKKLRRSPAHLRYSMDHPQPDTEALAFGRLLHSMILEPDQVESQYVFAPKLDKRTKEGKAAWEALQSDGRQVVSVEDRDKAAAMVAALRNDSGIASILWDCEGSNELTYLWSDDGLDCRARIDRVCEWRGMRCFVDYKTTQDASPDGFPYEARRHGYGIQCAHYLNGDRALTDAERPTFIFIAQEKEPPYMPALAVVEDEFVELHEPIVRGLVEQYRVCLSDNYWPGYGTFSLTK